jgi:tetratricopeptide (TPR) repeat protein
MSFCYRCLLDFKAALPHAQRWEALTVQLCGPRSKHHAVALEELCTVHTGLKDYPTARKAIGEALAIMEELGLQQSEEYGGMLSNLGGVDREQERYKEALVIYDKAKAVLVQYKQGSSYGALLNDMALCHENLHQWNEAVACYKEAVEHNRNLFGSNHPEYATRLWNLAQSFGQLKQFEEAIPRLEEALAIRQKVFGKQHQETVRTFEALAAVRQLAQLSRREINFGHEFRMCSQCSHVEEYMDWCPCFRALYCNADCQVQHWAAHKPHCNVCYQCSTVLTTMRRCARCKVAKYCSADCQKANWSEHKKDCDAHARK